MSYHKYNNDEDDDDVKLDIDDEQDGKDFKVQYPNGSSNAFNNPQGDEEVKENGKDSTSNNIITEVKEETNNGAYYGFTVDPEKLSELGAELLEEGKAFNKAITKYKRAFFNELANEVSAKSPLINSIDILS